MHDYIAHFSIIKFVLYFLLTISQVYYYVDCDGCCLYKLKIINSRNDATKSNGTVHVGMMLQKARNVHGMYSIT